MPKRILIDVAVLAQGTQTGVYRVTLELVKQLLGSNSVKVFFTLTQEQHFLDRGLDLREGLRTFGLAHDIKAPFISADMDPAFTDIDVYISPFFKVPEAWAREPRVHKAVVVYDLIPVMFPEFCQDVIQGLMTEFFDHLEPDWLVFAISEATRQDLLRYRPDIPAQHVHVCHLGADDRFQARDNPEAIAKVREKYAIPASRPYLLSVATLEIRKNLFAVLDGFCRYIRDSGDSASILVLSGMQGWKLDNLAQEISLRPELESRVVLTGFVDDEDLPVLYSGATVFVFMSFYEGFGLPPLEAMSCGIPVIASNRSSLPEVVGDAGILLDPEDTQALARSLAMILPDAAVQHRFAQHSLAQASGFSWQNFGTLIIDQLMNLEHRPTPYLSIITICFNERHVRDTCESVVNQTYRNFEWLVIDGGSDQATLAVLEEYREHMTCMVSEPDQGRYDAMNKGIGRSRGKYLLFLNAGDFLHSRTTLETIFRYSAPFDMMNLFSLKLNADVIYGEVIARETGMMPHPMWKTGVQTHDLRFFAGNSLPHQATFIKRELFDRYGRYDDALLYAADYEWFIRVLAFHQLRSQYLPAIVSVYNFEGTSSTSIDADAPHIIEINQIYSYYSNPEIQADWLSRAHEPATNPEPISRHHPADTEQVDRIMVPAEAGSAAHRKFHKPIANDLDFARRLAEVAASRLGRDSLRVLIDQCNKVLNATHHGVPAPLPDAGFDTDCLGHNTARLFITRMARAISEASLETDRVPHRRAIVFLRESLLAQLQRSKPDIDGLTGPDDAVPTSRYLDFAQTVGLDLPSLVEPEAYHLAQLALRSIAREKFMNTPDARDLQT